MKFSSFQVIGSGLANLLIFWCVFSHSSLVTASSSPTSSSTENEFDEGGVDYTGGTENVSREKNTTLRNVIVDDSTKNITTVLNSTKFSKNADAGMIPAWITTTKPVLSSPPPPLIVQARSTKLLEKPLESQLISQLDKSSSDSLSGSDNNALSLEKRRRLLRIKQAKPTATVPTTTTTTQNPNSIQSARRREDTNTPQIPLKEGAPPTELEFDYPVSPLEGSLGGLTALNELPPLSFIQFVKVLVAVTPFIIPLIFIPLLIFTIGLLMIPVTRGNVFVDIGDLRSPSPTTTSLVPSFISGYLVNPLKKWSGSDALVALPRSLAYDLGTKILDTEQCVERISCEISARYLHSNWEQGNWRSLANSGWISRILSYLWRTNPTISRIAKSLQARGIDQQNDSSRYYDNGSFLRSRNSDDNYKKKDIPPALCSRYTCQPKSFLRKLFSSQQQ